MLDLLITGGKIVTESSIFEADIGIKDGLIEVIGKNVSEPSEKVLKAEGKLVIPGGIDAHTHFQMPYRDTFTKDDFYSGTLAAACGGVTTVIDFVTPGREQSLIESLKKRIAEAEGKSVLDYGFHVVVNGLNGRREREIEELVENYGVTSFKIFTAYRARGLAMDDGSILRFLELASRLKILVGVHAENDDIINYNIERFLREGRKSPIYHALSRPPIAEAEAVKRMTLFAEYTGANLYIVHLSSRLGVEAVREARKRKVKVFAETCPHYLVFTDEVYNREDGYKFILSPPIKSREDREALWRGLRDGTIMTVGSDHAVFNLGEKQVGRDDFTKAPGGVQGTENIIPILFSEGVLKKRITLKRLVQLVSYNPARFFGLYPRKGTIQVGSDADLTILDPNKRIILGKNVLHSSIDHSIYEGVEVKGYPVTVISRGEILVEDMVPQVKPGRGRYLKREFLTEPEEIFFPAVYSS